MHNKIWKIENPKKNKCHNTLNNAIKRGEVKRLPCEICGLLESEGHHNDYNYPLKVRWLCRNHHKEWHKVHK
jgi:hypothetical protein